MSQPAAASAMVMMVSVAVVFNCYVAETTHYVVDDWGSGFDATRWLSKKAIFEGDTLQFNYDTLEENVIKVDEESYAACHYIGWSVSHNPKENFTLNLGFNYFLSGTHCRGAKDDVKLRVNAIKTTT